MVQRLKGCLDTSLVDIFCQGIKTYVTPKSLSKGMAVRRFCKYLSKKGFHGAKEATAAAALPCAAMEYGREPIQILAAGDSLFDVSMFAEADLAIAPGSLQRRLALPAQTVCLPEERVYAEEVLEYVLHIWGEDRGT